MVGKSSLFYFSIAFIIGNILTYNILINIETLYLKYYASIIIIINLLSLSLLIITRFKDIVVVLLAFFVIGSNTIVLNKYFEMSPYDSIFNDNEIRLISGVIESYGKGKKSEFIEISISKEKTIIYGDFDNLRNINIGDSLQCRVRIKRVTNFTDDFDYKSFMAKKNVYYTCFLHYQNYKKFYRVISNDNEKVKLKYKIKRVIIELQQRLERRFSKSISTEENLSLLKALSWGDKKGISEETKRDFLNSGAMHLIALSGLNVGIIYKILWILLSFAGNSPIVKKIRSVIVIIIIWLYAIFTGMGTSIVRAVLMATIYEFGIIFSRDKSGLNSLGLSAIIITLVEPDSPSEISFQLSFGAMLGILIIYPIIKDSHKIKMATPLKYLWEISALSISCQVFTTPIILLNFKSYALYSMITNLLCTPLTALVTSLTPISAITGTAYILDPLLSLLIYITSTISTML